MTISFAANVISWSVAFKMASCTLANSPYFLIRKETYFRLRGWKVISAHDNGIYDFILFM